jgi:RNA polymerase-interacting CarD/CdnL/TRCF family regulator
VQSIRKRSFSGSRGHRFAKMFFPRDEIIMLIREKDLDGLVRTPIARQKARKVLAYIGEWKGKVSDQWKTRANSHQAKLDDGNPFALAEVYKALSLRHEDDKLSAADRRHLSQSEQQLSEELALALGQSEDRMRRKLAATALG